MTTSATAAVEPPTTAIMRAGATTCGLSAPRERALSSAIRPSGPRGEWLPVGLLLALCLAIVFEFGVLYVSLLSQAP